MKDNWAQDGALGFARAESPNQLVWRLSLILVPPHPPGQREGADAWYGRRFLEEI